MKKLIFKLKFLLLFIFILINVIKCESDRTTIAEKASTAYASVLQSLASFKDVLFTDEQKKDGSNELHSILDSLFVQTEVIPPTIEIIESVKPGDKPEVILSKLLKENVNQKIFCYKRYITIPVASDISDKIKAEIKNKTLNPKSQILVIHLNRLVEGINDPKDLVDIAIPTELSVKEVEYKLFAVIYHTGIALPSNYNDLAELQKKFANRDSKKGPYSVLTKNIYDSDENDWWYIDKDSVIKLEGQPDDKYLKNFEIHGPEADFETKIRTPYILFYQKSVIEFISADDFKELSYVEKVRVILNQKLLIRDKDDKLIVNSNIQDNSLKNELSGLIREDLDVEKFNFIRIIVQDSREEGDFLISWVCSPERYKVAQEWESELDIDPGLDEFRIEILELFFFTGDATISNPIANPDDQILKGQYLILNSVFGDSVFIQGRLDEYSSLRIKRTRIGRDLNLKKLRLEPNSTIILEDVTVDSVIFPEDMPECFKIIFKNVKYGKIEKPISGIFKNVDNIELIDNLIKIRELNGKLRFEKDDSKKSKLELDIKNLELKSMGLKNKKDLAGILKEYSREKSELDQRRAFLEKMSGKTDMKIKKAVVEANDNINKIEKEIAGLGISDEERSLFDEIITLQKKCPVESRGFGSEDIAFELSERRRAMGYLEESESDEESDSDDDW